MIAKKHAQSYMPNGEVSLEQVIQAAIDEAAQSAAVPVVGDPVAWRWIHPETDNMLTDWNPELQFIRADDLTPLYEKPTTSITAAELDALRKDAELLLRLKSEIADRLYSYERFGATCTFEGYPMVHADILEELAAIAGENK